MRAQRCHLLVTHCLEHARRRSCHNYQALRLLTLRPPVSRHQHAFREETLQRLGRVLMQDTFTAAEQQADAAMPGCRAGTYISTVTSTGGQPTVHFENTTEIKCRNHVDY